MDAARRCTQCGRRLPLDAFYRDAKGRGGRQSACKALGLFRDDPARLPAAIRYLAQGP